MTGLRARGFSLVEVMISTTVLAAAALLLSATLGTSNAQKLVARRGALAKSLAVRQLELMQQRVSESTLGTSVVSMGGVPNSQFRLADLRANGNVYPIVQELTPAPPTGHVYNYRSTGTTLNNGPGRLVPSTSVFHVLFPSITPRPTQTPSGSMFQDELDRVAGEGIGVELFVAACRMDGHRDDPGGPAQISLNMQNPELLMAQVVVRDISGGLPGTEMFTLARMYRVQSAAAFGLEGQF